MSTPAPTIEKYAVLCADVKRLRAELDADIALQTRVAASIQRKDQEFNQKLYEMGQIAKGSPELEKMNFTTRSNNYDHA
jgi:hypothetical protein